MKAITVKQPYASLIVYGIKDIENRTWPCPKRYIGKRVLIHASASPVNMRNPSSVFTSPQWDSLTEEQKLLTINGVMPNGSIIGSVEIVGCVINHPSIWAEETEDYTVGMNPKLHEAITGEKVVYNWVLANPIIYNEPIENVKGKLSFWDYPGIKEVKIECPECGSIEIAVEDYTTAPFPTYLHRCNKCEYVIMESEWNVIK